MMTYCLLEVSPTRQRNPGQLGRGDQISAPYYTPGPLGSTESPSEASLIFPRHWEGAPCRRTGAVGCREIPLFFALNNNVPNG